MRQKVSGGIFRCEWRAREAIFVKGIGARMTRLIAGALCIVSLLSAVQAEGDVSQRPDIVFIIVDDLNDWIGCLGGHPDAKSPNTFHNNCFSCSPFTPKNPTADFLSNRYPAN